MRIKKRFGIIGCGNMGGAILAGLLKTGRARPGQVIVFDKVSSKAQDFGRRWKVKVGKGNREVVSKSEIVLLAVKPQDLFEASAEFRTDFKSRHTVLSILAGTPISKIKRAVGSQPSIVRAMPNLGAQVGQAITALTGKSARALREAETVFSACGQTVQLKEKHFDLVTAVSGSGPAYFFLIMELLAEVAWANGLKKEVARRLAVQTALGAALLARQSEFPPDELRRRVTSKGGTTAAALQLFQDKGLARIFKNGVEAALRRGRQLSQK